MTDEQLDAIEARANAATQGPWRWEVNRMSKSMHLVGSPKYGSEFVMGFVRWGMNGAQALFRRAVTRDGRTWHRMEKAEAFMVPIPGREHHADWAAAIDQPDAGFIAHARADVPALVAEVRRLRAALTEVADDQCLCRATLTACAACIARAALATPEAAHA